MLPVSLIAYHPIMEDIYIEPDPGQVTKLEIEDYDDKAYMAFKYGFEIFIQGVKVQIIDYKALESLQYRSGHLAEVLVKRLA